jgi:hypothetical protein
MKTLTPLIADLRLDTLAVPATSLVSDANIIRTT